MAGLVLVVSGCTGGADTQEPGATTDAAVSSDDASAGADEAASTTAAPEPVAAELVWAVDATVLSEPSHGDGVVVLYQQNHDLDMTLAAYDAATGDRLWTYAASPSASRRAAGSPAVVEVDGRHLVVTLAPLADGVGELVALDLADGTEVARAPEGSYAHSIPASCWVDETAVCFRAFSQDRQEVVDVEATVDGGTIRVEEVEDDAGDTEDEVAEDWTGFNFHDDGAGDAWFTYHDAGELVWEVDAAEAGHEVEPDDSAVGSFNPRGDVIVSDINWVPTRDGKPQDVPVDDLRTAAFDTATGEVLWTRTGTLKCGASRFDLSVLCEADQGEFTYPPGTTGEFTGDQARMLGVDRRTGDVVWSREITGEQWRALKDQQSVLTPPGLLPDPGDDHVLIEVATGESSDLDATEVDYACYTEDAWTYETPYNRESPEPEDRLTSSLFYACTLDGDPTQISSWPSDRDNLGIEAGDLRLITRPDRLEAYRVGG